MTSQAACLLSSPARSAEAHLTANKSSVAKEVHDDLCHCQASMRLLRVMLLIISQRSNAHALLAVAGCSCNCGALSEISLLHRDTWEASLPAAAVKMHWPPCLPLVCLQGLVPYMKAVSQRLEVLESEPFQDTPFGRLCPPLGQTRLKAAELIGALVRLGNADAETAIIAAGGSR